MSIKVLPVLVRLYAMPGCTSRDRTKQRGDEARPAFKQSYVGTARQDPNPVISAYRGVSHTDGSEKLTHPGN